MFEATVIHMRNPVLLFERDIDVLGAPKRIDDILREKGLIAGHGMNMRRQANFLVSSNLEPYDPKDDTTGPYLADWPEWQRDVLPGEILLVQAVPLGKGGSRIVGLIAIAVLSYYTGGLAAGATGAAAGSATYGAAFAAASIATTIAGGMLLNAVLPLPKPKVNAGEQTSPNYQISAQGNVARLTQAIPVIYGRFRVYPDYAATPYTENRSDDMYLYQLFSIGQGKHTIEQIYVGNTELERFPDVQTQIINPGERVTLFPDNVITSDDVQGIQLQNTTEAGITGTENWTVPYVLGPAGTKVTRIGIDFAYPQGVYYINEKGNKEMNKMAWKVQTQAVDDSGTPLGDWVTQQTFNSQTLAEDPKNLTYTYTVAEGRYQVRVTKLDVGDIDVQHVSTLVWSGLRGYVASVETYGNLTMLAVVMKATNAVNTSTQHQVSVIARRILPVWNGTTWTEQETRNPAWALADMFRNAEYGAAWPDSRLSLDRLLVLAATWETRQDYFDGVFDTKTTVWEAAKAVCRVGRTTPLYYAGVVDFIRDAPKSARTLMLHPGNTVAGSFSVSYQQITDETPDYVVAQYTDPYTWKPATVDCAMSDSLKLVPKTVEFPGIANHDHAFREGIYAAASNRDQRKIISLTTELVGQVAQYGDLVGVANDVTGWGQPGTLLAFNRATGILTLSDPVQFSNDAPTHNIALSARNGSVQGPYRVVPSISDTLIGATRQPLVTAAGATTLALVVHDGYVVTDSATVGELARTDWRGRISLSTLPRTNLIFPSSTSNTSDGIWVQSGPDWNVTTVLGPSGEMTARRAVLTKQSLGGVLYNGPSGRTIGRTYVASAYARGVNGGEPVNFGHTNASYGPSAQIQLTPDYVRYAIVYTSTTGGGYLSFDTPGYVDGGWGIDVDGAQLEELPNIVSDPLAWQASADITVSAASVNAPDGSNTAKTLSKVGAGSGKSTYIPAGNTLVGGPDEIWEALFWIAGTDTSTQVTCGLQSGGAGNWGSSLDDVQIDLIRGSGTLQLQSSFPAAVVVQGLTKNDWTVLRIRRKNIRAGVNLTPTIYPDTHNSSAQNVAVQVWESRVYKLQAPSTLIKTTNAPKTVIDYTASAAGVVTLGEPVIAGQQYDWTGSGKAVNPFNVALSGLTQAQRDAIFFSDGGSEVPTAYSFGPSTLQFQDCILLGGQPTSNGQTQLTLVNYSATVHLAETDQTVPPPSSPSGLTDPSLAPSVGGVGVTIPPGAGEGGYIWVSVAPVPGATSYEFEISYDNGVTWLPLGISSQAKIFVRLPAGNWLIRARAYGAGSLAGEWTTTPVTIDGKPWPLDAIQAFAASSAVFGINLLWSFPDDWGVLDAGATEIRYATSNTFSASQLLCRLSYPTNAYSMVGLPPGYRLWFWARIVSKSTGDPGPWTASVTGITSDDASAILQYIAGKLSEDQLTQELIEKIDAGNDAAAGLADVEDRLDQISGDIDQVSGIVARFSPPMVGGSGKIGASGKIGIYSEVSARQIGDYLVGQRVDSVVAQITGPDGQSLDQRIAASVTTLTEAMVSDISAVASQVTTVASQIGPINSAVQTNAQAITNLDGRVSASYQIKVQINTATGKYYAAGMSIGVDNTSGIAQSQIVFQADLFSLINVSNGNVSTPFTILNGVTYINSAFIADGTITNAKIGNTIQSNTVNGYNGSPTWTIDKGGQITLSGTTNFVTMNANGIKMAAQGGSFYLIEIGELS